LQHPYIHRGERRGEQAVQCSPAWCSCRHAPAGGSDMLDQSAAAHPFPISSRIAGVAAALSDQAQLNGFRAGTCRASLAQLTAQRPPHSDSAAAPHTTAQRPAWASGFYALLTASCASAPDIPSQPCVGRPPLVCLRVCFRKVQCLLTQRRPHWHRVMCRTFASTPQQQRGKAWFPPTPPRRCILGFPARSLLSQSACSVWGES